MSTKAKYRGGTLEFYESTSQERVGPMAPIVFYDDFLGNKSQTRSGTVTLDGSNPTTVETGLSSITGATVSLKAAATPGDDPTSFSVNYTAGTLDIYAYKTDGTDPTLVASTDSSATVDWVATGVGLDDPWSVVQVLLNTAMGIVDDAANGVLQMTFDADVNAEDAVLYWGDQKGINLKAGAVWEARIRSSVLPTLTSQAVFGMCGDHNLDKDAATESAWFKLDGNGIVVLETDDTTNNNDDKTSGITVLAADYHTYRIDFTNNADVRFYIDGNDVNSGFTFDMSNLTAGEAVMQPYISLDKGGDAGLGTLLVDYVRVWSNRS